MKLELLRHKILNTHFEVNNNYTRDGETIEIDISFKYKLIDETLDFSEEFVAITLQVEIFPETEELDYPFYLCSEIVGEFAIDLDSKALMMDSTTEKIPVSEMISILMSYLRAYFATLTSLAGLSTLNMPNLNIKEIFGII